MLVEINKLNISNDGYVRNVTIGKMYVNINHIVSITDYNEVKSFLIAENVQLTGAGDNYSLLKVLTAGKVEEIIAVGSSEELFSNFNKSAKKVLLNG